MGILAKGHKGFTIIEVMLFLAVSGALAAGVLGGSSVAINNQRYVDAANSFKAVVQEEFINTTRVANLRDAKTNFTCPADPTSEARPRGASDCVIVGRLVSIATSGEMTRSNIIGVEPTVPTTPAPANDIEAIKAYQLTIDMLGQETTEMSWGTSIRRGGEENQAASIIILRAPSGNVLSLVDTQAITSNDGLKDYINSANNSQPKTLCVATSGWTVAQMQAVVIPAYASTPSVVEQRQVEDTACN